VGAGRRLTLPGVAEARQGGHLASDLGYVQLVAQRTLYDPGLALQDPITGLVAP
jgi:hypothetical protein